MGEKKALLMEVSEISSNPVWAVLLLLELLF
jgi:hypothetical protein